MRNILVSKTNEMHIGFDFLFFNQLGLMISQSLLSFQLANLKETRSSNKSAIQFFDAVLQQQGQNRNIEALFGKVYEQ